MKRYLSLVPRPSPSACTNITLTFDPVQLKPGEGLGCDRHFILSKLRHEKVCGRPKPQSTGLFTKKLDNCLLVSLNVGE